MIGWTLTNLCACALIENQCHSNWQYQLWNRPWHSGLEHKCSLNSMPTPDFGKFYLPKSPLYKNVEELYALWMISSFMWPSRNYKVLRDSVWWPGLSRQLEKTCPRTIVWSKVYHVNSLTNCPGRRWVLIGLNGTSPRTLEQVHTSTYCPGGSKWLDWTNQYHRKWSSILVPYLQGMAYLTSLVTIFYRSLCHVCLSILQVATSIELCHSSHVLWSQPSSWNP